MTEVKEIRKNFKIARGRIMDMEVQILEAITAATIDEGIGISTQEYIKLFRDYTVSNIDVLLDQVERWQYKCITMAIEAETCKNYLE